MLSAKETRGRRANIKQPSFLLYFIILLNIDSFAEELLVKRVVMPSAWIGQKVFNKWRIGPVVHFCIYVIKYVSPQVLQLFDHPSCVCLGKLTKTLCPSIRMLLVTKFKVNFGILLHHIEAQIYWRLPVLFQITFLTPNVIPRANWISIYEDKLLLAHHVSLVFTASQIDSALFI